MAEPTGLGAFELGEVMADEEKREKPRGGDSEKLEPFTHSSSGTPEEDATPDPLARLPEKFRKEIEAQVEVKSRRATFPVISLLIRVNLIERNSFDLLVEMRSS
jgi:hypothetical protein